jgi:uncharacterized protein (DUF952 family)
LNCSKKGQRTVRLWIRADGFIHFSTADQVAETAARHFAGEDGLILAAFEADDLGAR